MFIDDYVWVREGERKVIPSTDGQYYIENKKFHLEYYDEDDERYKEAMERLGQLVVKNYQTDVVIYKVKGETIPGQEPELEKVTEDAIRLNEPLKFDGYHLYQSGYQENEFSTMTFGIFAANDEEKSFGEFTVDLMSPEETYELENGFKVEISQYFPDYILQDGEPTTQSKFPKNPAFVFRVYPPDSDEPEVSFIGIGRNIDPTGENKYRLGITDFSTHYASGLTVRKDLTLPIFVVGAAIFMIGVIQGMYWQHRRVWINEKEGTLLLAAHTNKNWFGIKRDIEKALEGTEINMVVDQEEEDLEKVEQTATQE